MPERMGLAHWPGVRGFISCSYTCSHDVTPGIASLEIPEQDIHKVQPFGDLVITDGSGTVTLKNARVVDVRYLATAGAGRTMVLQIADRRWRWRFGQISGNWNQHDPFPDPELFPPGEYTFAGGPYAPGTCRSAHLLMADCFAAMNERKPLINPAPVIPIPVRWDVENPAQALASLAAQLGYRIVYQPVTDRVLVAKAGTGKVLPDVLPMVDNHAALSLPGRPNAIALFGGPTLYHDYLALEPVGLEKDGTVKPIDKLSYAPVAGWGSASTVSFFEARATAQLTHEDAMALAKTHIWRTFRVKMKDVANTVKPGPNVGGYGRIHDRKQLILGNVIYDATRGVGGQPNSEPAFIVGSVYVANGVAPAIFGLAPGAFGGNLEFGTGQRLPWRPAIDAERGLVHFDRQMYLLNNGQHTAPDIYLYTSFNIRSIIGWVPDRFAHGGVTAGPNTGCPAEFLHHPEIVRIVRTSRRDADLTVTVVADNAKELLPQANYYLSAADAKYQIGAATDRTYAGIVPLDPDGAIQQVTWSVGGGAPATTRASRNCEHAEYLMSYPERRRVEDLRVFLEKAKKAEAEESAPPIGPGQSPPQMTVDNPSVLNPFF